MVLCSAAPKLLARKIDHVSGSICVGAGDSGVARQRGDAQHAPAGRRQSAVASARCRVFQRGNETFRLRPDTWRDEFVNSFNGERRSTVDTDALCEALESYFPLISL